MYTSDTASNPYHHHCSSLAGFCHKHQSSLVWARLIFTLDSDALSFSLHESTEVWLYALHLCMLKWTARALQQWIDDATAI